MARRANLSWPEIAVNAGYQDNPVGFAAYVYEGRNAEKGRRVYPPWGSQTKNKIWLPYPMEVRACCQVINPPNIKYPWTYQRHCRTALHVAQLFGVDEKDLLAAVGKKRKCKTRRCVECNSRFVTANDYLCKQCREGLTSPS